MPKFNIEVEIDPSGAVRGSRQVNNQLNKMSKSADKLRNLITRAVAFIGVGVGIRKLKNLTDTYTNLQNRLRTVTDTQAELNAVTNQLFKSSNLTRGSFEATVEVYTRTALATRELGISQKETIEFTESLNKAVILSGAGAQEASAGLLQLSQGLASGTLRGDELRSVLEQLPVVADVISKSMGITRGELRKLGTEGKITAEIILKAFREAREELSERFLETLPTIGQSLQVLRNNFIKAIGTFDQASGSSRALSRIILTLAENIDVLIRSVVSLGIALSVGLAKKGIGSVIKGIKALNVLIAANPIGALLVVITLAVSALIGFSDQIAVSSDGLVSLRDTGQAAFELISDQIGIVVDLFHQELPEAIAFANTLIASFGLTFGDVLQGIKLFANTVISVNLGLFRSVKLIITRLVTFLNDAFNSSLAQNIIGVYSAIFTFIKDTFSKVVGVVIKALNIVGVAVDEFSDQIGIAFEFPELVIPQGITEFGAELKNEFLRGFETDFVGIGVDAVTSAFEKVNKRAREISDFNRAEAARRAKEEQDAIAKLSETGVNVLAISAEEKRAKEIEAVIQMLSNERSAIGLTNSQLEVENRLLKIQSDLKKKNIELSATEIDLVRESLQATQDLQEQQEAYEQLNSAVIEYTNTQGSLNKLMDAGRISLEQYNVALSQTQLGSDITQLQEDLLSQEEGLTANLEAQLEQRKFLVQQAQEAGLISLQERNALELEITRAHNAEIFNIENERYSMQLNAASRTFGSLSQIAKGYAGEQSTLYKGLFAASKAFAIADSTVQIANALAKAANTPFPANLAAIATVAAQTASIVGTIQGTSAGNFQTGGSFKVGGSGGADSQMVAFRASPDETVTIRTPNQQDSANSAQAPASEGGQGITIVNLDNPDMVEDFMTSSRGEKVLVNIWQRNANQLSGIERQ